MKRLMMLFVSVCLIFTLACPTLTASAAQPQGYWPYFQAYTKAVESGDADEILKTGDALLLFYAAYAMNQDIASMSYNIYLYRFEKALFEHKGDYDAAVSNAKKLAEVSRYLGYDDMAIAAEAAVNKLDPMTEVYAVSKDGSGSPYYGAKHEPVAGTYYGRVLNMDHTTVKNADEVSGESIVSIYLEVGDDTAQDFSWLIGRYDDGRHAIHIALNFPGEGRTAEEISSGKHDGNIKETLSYLAALKSPVFLRIGAEMNLWGMDPAVFKKAFIRTASLARSTAPNVALVWSPNYVGYWGSEFSDYYPGDTYVDWIGTSLYANSTPNQGQSEYGADSLYFGVGAYADSVLNMKGVAQFALQHRKPVIVTEGGTGIVSNSGTRFDQQAAAQVTKMYSVLNMVYPNIKAIVYFDADISGGKYKYAMSNSSTVTAAYRTAVASNPTLISSAGSTACSFVKLADFSEKADSVDIRAYSDTVYSDSMTVKYYLSGNKIAEASTLPYGCTVDTGRLAAGRYEFKVVFSDGKGYSKTKTYTLTKLMSGVVSFTAGYDASAALDVPSSWAQEEVALALSLDLVPAALQKNYTGNINRLDFCRLIITLIEQKTGMGIDAVLSGRGLAIDYGAFTDTTDKHVLAAYALGIVSGRGGGVFDCNASITREEAAKMLSNAAAVLGIKANGPAVTFADAFSFSSWAVDSIRFVSSTVDQFSGNPVMGGTGENKFTPGGKYTCQQAFITMLRLYRAG